MAGAKNVIDMRPGKGFTTSQSNEHLRVFSDKDRAKKAQWNYDPSREHLNFEIGKGGVVMKVNKMKSIPQRIAENLEARGIKDPNLSLINQGKRPYFKTVANFILGGNREVMRNLAFGNQNVNWEQGADNTQLKRMPEIENWAKDAYRFMCKKYGEKNIAAFVVHLDEANPHIHCTVLPITPKEKFSFLGVFLDGHDDKEALSRHMTNLHTEFANEVGIKYGLERGDSIKETGAEHRTTEEYRERLWKEAQQKEAEVEENNKTIEGNKKTIDTQNNIMDSQSREIKHAAARLKALQTMIKNLQTHKMDLEGEVKKLERDLESGKITKEEADHQAQAYGHIMKEDAGRGYRRVVASPKPVEIVEQDAINSLVDANKIVICCGGGGIPVVLNGHHLKGASAVIDKDFASCLLAKELDADMLIILTAVEKVAVNFGKENEEWLDDLTVDDAKKYIDEGQFAPGSMLPKVQAAVDFASSKEGRTAMITLLEKAKDGIQGKTGTKIHL